MTSNYTQQINKPTTYQLLQSLKQEIFSEMNCIKVGIIEEYYAETRTAKVFVVNKKVLGLNPDGSQIVRDYPPLFVNVMFLGSSTSGIDWVVKKGDECIVFFSDRELDSWFATGEISTLASFRMHDITDGIALAGLRSTPGMSSTDGNINIFNTGGIINMGTVKAASYQSSDGTAGITTTQVIEVGGDVTKTMTIKNGLITGIQ